MKRLSKMVLLLPIIGWLLAIVASIYLMYQPSPFIATISNRHALFLLSNIFLYHILEFGSINPRWHTGLLSFAVVLTLFQSHISQVVLFAGLVYLAMTINSLREQLVTQRQYFVRNQLFYWLLDIAFLAIAGYALWFNLDAVFDFILPLASVTAIIITCVLHLPDVKFVLRGVVRAVLLSVWLVLIFVGAVFTTNTSSSLFPFPFAIGLALALTVVTVPLADRLFEQMLVPLFSKDRRTAEILIGSISAALRDRTTLPELCDVLEKVIIEDCYASSFQFVIADLSTDSNSAQEYRLSTLSAHLPTLPAIVIPVNGSASSWFFRQQNSISFHSDLIAALAASGTDQTTSQWFDSLKGFLYIPFFDQDQWIGFLSVGQRRRGGFEHEEMTFFTALSTIAGKAIVNAKLLDKLTKSNAELERTISTLQNITKDLSNFEVIKSNFISIASHELRTPLTVTRGYVEMLLEDQNLPNTQRDLLNGIYKGVLKQEEILDSLFELARLDSSSDILRAEELSLNDIIREVSQKVSKQVNQRQQVLVVDLPALPRIVGDRASIRRLFLNIVQNAIKFTPDHGKITISAIVTPPIDHQDEGIEVIIRDTGVGISKELQDVIFTRFYQPGEKVDHLSSSKFRFKGSGLGLGLALSRAIIKAHGGRIWVVSAGNDERGLPGSEFHLFFPFQPKNVFPST